MNTNASLTLLRKALADRKAEAMEKEYGFKASLDFRSEADTLRDGLNRITPVKG